MKRLSTLTLTLLLIFASGEILEKCENPEEESAADFDFGQVLSFEWWLTHFRDAYVENPYHMVTEAIFVILIVYLMLRKPESDEEEMELSEDEEKQMIEGWYPEPLVPVIKENGLERAYDSSTPVGPNMSLDGQNVLNFVSFDFFGHSTNPEILKVAEKTIKKYAVGSCGPRGFYGTMDVHLDLEERLGKLFSETGEPVQCTIYADWLGCPPSMITAFAKRSDLIIADEGVHWLFKQGIVMSRAKVIYYDHNDLDALEGILQGIQQKDNQDTHFKLNRRFIVTEGIFENSGAIVDLPRLIKLKNMYKYRLIYDDSNAFGALGIRGTPDHFGVPPSEIDVYGCSMDKALGSIGGFVIGGEEITSHQRLSSFGYVFSASGPPFQVTAASKAAELFTEEKVKNLAKKINYFVTKVTKDVGTLTVTSNQCSPLVYLQLKKSKSKKEDMFKVQKIADACKAAGLFLFCTNCFPDDKYKGEPSLRLVITAQHTKEMMNKAIKILKKFSN